MAKKRHMTKNEILRAYNELLIMRKNADKAPFTSMATLCNYILWKDEKWYQKKLADYNQRIADCDRMLDDGVLTLEGINEKLFEKAEFKVDYVPFTYADIKVSEKMGLLYKMEKEIIDNNNTINEMSVRYFLLHYWVLMQMGYGKTRLERNKDYINKRLGEINRDDKYRIMDLHRELLNSAGIYIEMPYLGD